MPVLRFLLTAAIAVLLTACGPRPVIFVDEAAASVGKVQRVFVGTTRQRDPETRFGAERSGDLAFARYDVSVPPAHETGRIEWPRQAPDATQHFIATEEVLYQGAGEFRRDLRQALLTRPVGKRVAIIYVHGFNNTFSDGVYRLAQMSHDFGLPDVAVHYSWPSAGSALGYAYDHDSVLFARDGLEELLSVVRAAGANEVLLVGHSIGAQLVMETLRQMAIANPRSLDRQVGGVVLLSPDIDIDLFRQQAARIGDLPQPFAIFSSDRDRALRLSARLTGRTDRLGNVTDPEILSDLEVTIFDLSEFSDGPVGHFSAATSPALIRILKLAPGIEAAFANDPSGRAGLIPGTVLTVQNATQVILNPAAAGAQ